MIKKIRLQGLLSFEDMELELRNLNVLIGPNGSGKSNLIEALSLLQALPTDIGEPIRRGGGIGEWLRKSAQGRARGRVHVELQRQAEERTHYYLYGLELLNENDRYAVVEEQLEQGSLDDLGERQKLFDSNTAGHGPERQSVLSGKSSWRAMPGQVGDLVHDIGELFGGLRLYRDWSFGGNAVPRGAQPTDLPVDFLLENASNLALIVSTLVHTGAIAEINEHFHAFYQRFQRLSISVYFGKMELFMYEEGVSEPIPTIRWSDGMLRYLTLLLILCHPSPPDLICIEEPELGLHPDILPDLARLIKDASERTQIIITTHSKQLVDEFSDDPEAVVVCERGFDGESTMRRLDAKKLGKWLEEYSLGDLWESGEIGGDLY